MLILPSLVSRSFSSSPWDFHPLISTPSPSSPSGHGQMSLSSDGPLNMFYQSLISKLLFLYSGCSITFC